MSVDTSKLFQEARQLADSDRSAAVELYKRIVELPPGPHWGDAQLEVAGWEHQHYHLEEARRRYESIVEAERSVASGEAWRTAAVMLCSVHEDMDRPVDDDLLRRGLEACAAAHHEHDEYLAGVAAGHLARIELAANRRDSARAYLVRAETHFTAAGSMTGGPGAAHQLAKLAAEDGDIASAKDWLRRGLEQLAKFPHGGRGVREMRQKLEAFEAQLGAGS